MKDTGSQTAKKHFWRVAGVSLHSIEYLGCWRLVITTAHQHKAAGVNSDSKQTVMSETALVIMEPH